MTKISDFPAGFLWGASTASHQVEGSTNTQWDDWERVHAASQPAVTRQMLGKLERWPDIADQAAQADNYIAGRGVEHYDRYRQDFDMLERLNMNAFRFSLEWARIEPQPGVWDEAAIEHYRQYLLDLQKRGITPFMTLFHFTLPVWFDKRGGFTKAANLRYFTDYATKIAQSFQGLVRFVTPVNEANVYTLLSYAMGLWPPQRKNPLLAYRVYKNLIRAHRAVFTVYRQVDPAVKIGTAAALSWESVRPHLVIARLVQAVNNKIWNHWYVDAVATTSDFIGVNYYLTNQYAWYGGWRNPKRPRNDLGWYMQPADIQQVLESAWRRWRKPLYITENGLADAADSNRKWWLEQTIDAMWAARLNGVDLRGYLHWSLLDNFEWAYGWFPKFGLIAVDRTTMQRTIRLSAKWFGQRIAELRTDHSDDVVARAASDTV